jgi:hypothetical protein
MITIEHTLRGHQPTGPDDLGEATHWRLKFTDEDGGDWTYIANDDVPIDRLMKLLERTFEVWRFDRISADMKKSTKAIVGFCEDDAA